MTKKDFIKLVLEHRDKFKCLSIVDATIRYNSPRFCIEIVWNTGFNTTPVCYGMGEQDSLAANSKKELYTKWLNQNIR